VYWAERGTVKNGSNDNNAPAREKIEIFKKNHLSLAGALLENNSLRAALALLFKYISLRAALNGL
jgi:hypothetical protein